MYDCYVVAGLGVDKEKLLHPSLLHIQLFVSKMNEELLEIFQSKTDLQSVENYSDVLALLQCYDRFVWLCHQPIKSLNKHKFTIALGLYFYMMSSDAVYKELYTRYVM